MWWASYSARASRRCRSPKISIRSVTSVRAVSTNRCAYAFARGLRGRDRHGVDAGAGQDRAERGGELPGPVTDQEPETGGTITQIHQQIADLLHGPGPVRVRGDTEDVHAAGADLHDEQAVQALQGHRAVHVEEVGGEHRRCLSAQERPPRRIGAPSRRRRDLQRLEDPADRGRAHPVTELEQFAPDPPGIPSRGSRWRAARSARRSRR